MKNFKNMSLLAIGFMLFAQLHGSDSQALEFPPHTTEKYMYNKSVETVKHGSMYLAIFGKHPDGISVTDETSEELLSSRVNRKRVETKTENGISITTTETWTSRNPSYLTWTNGALVVSAIAGIAFGVAGINALSNVSAATVNTYGNVASAGINAAGNIGAVNPEVQKLVSAGVLGNVLNYNK